VPGGLTGTDEYEYDASGLKNIPCLTLPGLALPCLAVQFANCYHRHLH